MKTRFRSMGWTTLLVLLWHYLGSWNHCFTNAIVPREAEKTCAPVRTAGMICDITWRCFQPLFLKGFGTWMFLHICFPRSSIIYSDTAACRIIPCPSRHLPQCLNHTEGFAHLCQSKASIYFHNRQYTY